MKCFSGVLFCFVFFSVVTFCPIAAADSNKIGAVLIPAKTEVKIALTGNLSSRLVKKGDPVIFRVAESVDGKIGNSLIPAGNRVEGEVLQVRRPGLFSQPGLIKVGNLRVQAFDNCFYPLTGNMTIKGRGDQTVAIGVAIGLSWPVAFFPGSEAIATDGTVFSASVAEDCWCQIVNDRPVYFETRNSVSRQAWEKTVALAENGDSESAYKVAVWAYYGIGMHANPAFALKYLELALSGGLPENLQEPAAGLMRRLAGSAVLF
ncbi:MAG: hypothetical protein PHD82_10255 [Candidatus Riflebacteria bacterium]|jgi:hypothetical protein|nr:hypothetical protein [Candidatus Riflebacteria bacterium]